jgi:hemerythrin-like domain-containing protein
MELDRRGFIARCGAATAAAALATACRGRSDAKDEEVTPAEDLMREHGVLRRVVYLYDEGIARLAAGTEVPRGALAKGAQLIRRFIEDYHERMEEQFVFPRFEAAGKLPELTSVLRGQHQIGRELTDRIIALAPSGESGELSAVLHRFGHMYRAHAAREDTVLFPELRGLVGAKAYAELGEQLEDKEHELVGEGGFEHAVIEVAALEREFGVDDLAKLSV